MHRPSALCEGGEAARMATELIAIEVEDAAADEGERVITVPSEDFQFLIAALDDEGRSADFAGGLPPHVRPCLERALRDGSVALADYERWEVLWAIQRVPRERIPPALERLRGVLLDAVATQGNGHRNPGPE